MVDCFEGSTDVQSSKELCVCGSNLLTVDLMKVLTINKDVFFYTCSLLFEQDIKT